MDVEGPGATGDGLMFFLFPLFLFVFSFFFSLSFLLLPTKGYTTHVTFFFG